jgi:Alginate export
MTIRSAYRHSPTARLWIASAAAFSVVVAASGRPSAGELPAYKRLRYEEDYAAHRTGARHDDGLESLKFIPIAEDGSYCLTLGGEGHWRYEYIQNPTFGATPQDRQGVALQRYSALADLHLGPSFRLFSQLTSALQTGRRGGPSPVDQNDIEFQNLFADVRIAPSAETALTLRGGRQELAFGSGRIVDVREGPNVRHTFDGGRAISDIMGWRLDGLYVAPRIDHRGPFDDSTSNQEALWGVSATRTALEQAAGAIEFYYLGYRNDSATYAQGTAQETRHSLGTRLSGTSGFWDWNWEALYQFGSFGSSDIRAWTLATDTGFTISPAVWKPRFGLSANVASGDKNPNDRRLETFNPLFPRGSYFSADATLGPCNFFNLQPSLRIHPVNNWTVEIDYNLFWRLETADGVYAPSGRLLRAAGGSGQRYVATGLSLSSEWQIDRHWLLAAS